MPRYHRLVRVRSLGSATDLHHRRRRLGSSRPSHANAVDGKALTYLSDPLASTTTMGAGSGVRRPLRAPAAPAQHRPAGDPDRGPTRRQGDPGPERLDARQCAQGRCRPLHRCSRSSRHARQGCGEPPGRRVLAHADRDLPVCARLPSGEQGAHHHHGARRRPHRLGVQHTLPGKTPTNEIAHSVGRPSSVALPVIPGAAAPAALPACPGLRGQPCRTYVAACPDPSGTRQGRGETT